MKKQLEQLGLTKNEAEIYLTLAKLGPATKAGALIKATGQHRNIVYTALESLVAKKLVTASSSSGVQCYTTSSPEQFIATAKQQVLLAEQVTEQLKQLVQIPGQEIIVYQGKEDVIKFELEHILSMTSKDEMVIIGVVGNPWYNTMGSASNLYYKRAHKTKMKQRWIGYSKDQMEALLSADIPNVQYRYLDSETLARSNIEIGPDYVAMKHFGPQPFVVFIRNEDMVRDYKNYFEALWKQAHTL